MNSALYHIINHDRLQLLSGTSFTYLLSAKAQRLEHDLAE